MSEAIWKNDDEVKQRNYEELLIHYRIFRRGLIALPDIERTLFNDLRRATEIVHEQRTPNLLVELAIQSLEAAKENIEQVRNSFAIIHHSVRRQFEEYVSSHGNDAVMKRLAEFIHETIPNSFERDLTLAFFRWNGSVIRIFEEQDKRLNLMFNAYTESSALAKSDKSLSLLNNAFQILMDYKDKIKDIRQEYAKKLAEAMKKDAVAQEEGKLQVVTEYTIVAYELCVEFPDIAKEFNINCQEVFDSMPGSQAMVCPHVLACLVVLAVLACMRWC